MSFDTIIGNEKIKQTLQENIKNNNILHSYMFVGQEGIGKKLFANEFSKELLCMSDNKKNCETCNSCIKFNSFNHPDFMKIEAEGNSIKISQIREMQASIYQKPIISDKKVFIINNADKMTQEAQNSLLKTLEEPPRYIVIILIVSNENILLNTIRSRCLKLYFKNIEDKEIVKYINDNNLIEKTTKNIINMCNGSIGKIYLIKDNIQKYNATEEIIEKIIKNKNISILEILSNSEVLYKSKEEILELLEYMTIIFYNKIVQDKINMNKYIKSIKIINDIKNKLKSNCNYDMCIDLLLLNIWEEFNEKYSRS